MYRTEAITFQVPLSESIVEVRSVVVASTGDIPIYYMVKKEDGQWKVFDVIIEVVSLVENYRTQFREILANNSSDEPPDVLAQEGG